jgi:hypothetical protein
MKKEDSHDEKQANVDMNEEKYIKGLQRIRELDHQLAVKELELRSVRANLISNRVKNNECMESIEDLKEKLYLTELRSQRSITSAKSNRSTISNPLDKTDAKKPGSAIRSRTFKNPNNKNTPAKKETNKDHVKNNKEFLG